MNFLISKLHFITSLNPSVNPLVRLLVVLVQLQNSCKQTKFERDKYLIIQHTFLLIGWII